MLFTLFAGESCLYSPLKKEKFMNKIKEYHYNQTNVAEWLPWGAITLPMVLEQKDRSYLGMIRYSLADKKDASFSCPAFRRGWTLWDEVQHRTDSSTEHLLIMAWNPFIHGAQAVNTLGKPVPATACLEYFAQALHNIVSDMPAALSPRLLEYQEIIDVLSFTLSFGTNNVIMPDVPLYLDALLSQDLNFRFGENDLSINDRQVTLITMLGEPDLRDVFEQLEHIEYRYTKRLLCFSDKEAQSNMRKYTARWCPSRKYVKNTLIEPILQGSLHGYYDEALILLLAKEEKEDVLETLVGYLHEKEILYRIEDYNLKDKWWGYLPGIFRANIEPPLISFDEISDFIETNPEIIEKIIHADEDIIKEIIL